MDNTNNSNSNNNQVTPDQNQPPVVPIVQPPIPQQAVPLNTPPKPPPQESFDTQVPLQPPPPPVQPLNTNPLPGDSSTEGGKSKVLLYLIVLIVIIVTVVAMVLIFLNFSQTKKTTPVKNNQTQVVITPSPTVIVDDQDTKALSTQGTSDNPSEIENDLNSTDLSKLDKEMGSISAEIQQ